MAGTVLVVDDERNIRRTLRMVLEGDGLEVRDVERAEEALQVLAEEPIDAVITDIRLPGMSGIDLLQQIRRMANWNNVPVLVISGHATVGVAVDAIKLGATDFFEKPLDRDRVLVSVRNALRASALAREVDALRSDAGARAEMVGESAAMRRLYQEVEKVAPTRGRVLITGESGTGKELVARAIHRMSPRHEGPFVKVNCAAIPAELVESELFGHEKGAFTGAVARKRGHFEAADRGTLFLDEIGDMPLAAQAKVLRALETGEVSRVGSDQTFKVDVRVLAATHRDLEREAREGRFREDLYFRLNVVPIRSPALREHPEDIPMLVGSFLREFCRQNQMKPKPVAPEVIENLKGRGFPGNVRELRNLVERVVILSGDEITLDDLPEESRHSREVRARLPTVAPEAAPLPPGEDDDDEIGPAELRVPGERVTLRQHRDDAERAYILDTLKEVDWNISRAATLLGLERTNLHKKIRGLGLKREG
ncbi:MAG: Sigma-54 dependent transcriptional regulator/response regulator [Myxococcaceae bacterium]|nr:Sigma-54 dependent transcriptional regulator/response regulator [Myxococcaceae bacterium]